jgi:hypothetical protein
LVDPQISRLHSGQRADLNGANTRVGFGGLRLEIRGCVPPTSDSWSFMEPSMTGAETVAAGRTEKLMERWRQGLRVGLPLQHGEGCPLTVTAQS